MRQVVRADGAQREQRLVHFVGIAWCRPGFLADRGDRLGIEPAKILGTLRVREAARGHGLRASLFQWRAVEECIRPCAEDFRGQRGRRRQVARDDARLAAFQALQQCDQAVQVHRVIKAIPQRLRDQRVVRNAAFAHDVLEARHLVGKHRGEQVFRTHALYLRRDFRATREARQRERRAGVPAKAQREHRCIQQRLRQHVAHRVRMQVARDFVEREAVAGRERQHDRVLGRGGLQFEVEVAAEALAQRQAPCAIEAAAERRVDDQLHAAGFVEEAFHRQRRLGRQQAEFGARGGEVIDQLSRGGLAEADFVGEPCRGRFDVRVEARRDFLAQARHRGRQFVAASGRFAQPERDRRRRALCVFHAHLAAFHPQDAVRLVAELEDVAGDRLDREILVHAADAQALRFQHHVVIGGVGNRAARGDRGEPCAASRAQLAVHRVAVQVGRTGAAPGAVTLGQHPHHFGERLAREIAIRIRAPEHVEQLAFMAFAAGDFRHDLLRQHVQRGRRDAQGVEFAAAHRVQQCRAFDQVVARGREQPRFRRPVHRVAGTAGALQERRDGTRRSQLADQVDVADVDAEFQRGGRDQRAQFPGFQPLLGVEALFLRQAAMVRGHRVLAQPLGEMAGGAFHHAPGIGEDQRGAVSLDQLRETVVNQTPGIVAHHRLERNCGQFDREIPRASVAGVDDGAVVASAQEPRDFPDRLLRGRQPDAGAAPAAQCVQSLQREREMAAAFAAYQRVDFVHDHRARGLQHAPAGFRAQQDVQRFRGGHDDVRRALAHRIAFGLRRVAGAHGGADFDVGRTQVFELRANAFDRHFEVDAYVVGQSLQRRHVHDPGGIGELAGRTFAHQFVDRGQERRQRLARTGRRGDQHIATGLDRRPGFALGFGRCGERRLEPGGDGGMECLHGTWIVWKKGSGAAVIPVFAGATQSGGYALPGKELAIKLGSMVASRKRSTRPVMRRVRRAMPARSVSGVAYSVMPARARVTPV